MIACAKCSHWENRQKIVVHHDTIADVRRCHQAGPRVPERSSVVPTDEQRRTAIARNMPVATTGWPSLRETVAAGRYAIEVDGTLKFYRVDKPTEGRWAGRTFVSVQASDELYPVRNPNARQEILNLIARDPKAAMLRYGQEIGKCGHCGRTLTDATSRARGIGPVCIGKLDW